MKVSNIFLSKNFIFLKYISIPNLFCCFRQPSAEFLLHGGQSMTWLLGNKLITVTTSGCSQKPIRNDLCDRCNHLCRLDKGELHYKLTFSSKLKVYFPQVSIQNFFGKRVSNKTFSFEEKQF